MRLIFACFVFLLPTFASCQDVVFTYKTHCSSCHGLDRLGGSGPALLPENLGRLKPAEALDAVAQGRPATQMLGFSSKLSVNEIQSLVDYIYTPLASVPEMGLKDIESTRIIWFKPSG
jgi:mono/diheme cytochrome c family protein